MRRWREPRPLFTTTIWGDVAIVIFAWVILGLLTVGAIAIYSAFRRSGLSAWIHLTMGEVWSEIVGFIGLVGCGVLMVLLIVLATFASISDEDR